MTLLLLRLFFTLRIVAYPAFQMAFSLLLVAVSSFGLVQVFTEYLPTFPSYTVWYGSMISGNLIATIILAAQLYDMGIMSWNCGDVPVCVAFVRPEAVIGWVIVGGSVSFVRRA